jgi:hypothetical protein
VTTTGNTPVQTKRRPSGRRSVVRQNGGVDFKDLIARPLPESTVTIGGFELHLRAVTSKALDDLITKYPPDKGTETVFHPDMRYELIAATVTSVDMDIDQAKELLNAWSRPDVTKLQSAVFDVNWVGAGDDQVPLSETASEETDGTPPS